MTAEETGVYITLIARMYEMAGPIERDDDRLYRICGCKSKRAFVKIVDHLVSVGVILRLGRKYSAPLLERWAAFNRKGQSRPNIPSAIKKHVFQRDGMCCVYCGKVDGPFHLDHITPWSRGGNHSAENLCVACAPCNLSKGDKTLEEWSGVQ